MCYLVLDVFKVFLTCILSKNIVLTIMDFKISDTNSGKKSLLHNGYILSVNEKLPPLKFRYFEEYIFFLQKFQFHS